MPVLSVLTEFELRISAQLFKLDSPFVAINFLSIFRPLELFVVLRQMCTTIHSHLLAPYIFSARQIQIQSISCIQGNQHCTVIWRGWQNLKMNEKLTKLTKNSVMYSCNHSKWVLTYFLTSSRFPETAKIRKKLPKPGTIFFEKGIIPKGI